MTALSVLVPDVRVEIPEIQTFVAERQLLRAAREFCEITRAWRVDIQVSVTADAPTVDLTAALPANTELVDIVSVKNLIGGAPIRPTTYKRLDEDSNDWRTETNTDASWYVLDGNNTIRFIPIPSITTVNKYYVRLAVKPLLTATVIDSIVANKYDEVLVHGALSKLYLIPRKPWTDASLAPYRLALFERSMPAARTEAAEEFQTGVARKVKYGGL